MLDKTRLLEDRHQRSDMSGEQLREELNRQQQQQGQLQSDLNRMQQELGREGLQPGEGLAEAEKSMKNSQEALRDGNGRATQNQADALDAMRRGARNLMEQMREALKKAGENQTADTVSPDPLGTYTTEQRPGLARKRHGNTEGNGNPARRPHTG